MSPNRLGYQVFPSAFGIPFHPAEVDIARLKLKRSVPGVIFNNDESQRHPQELSGYSTENTQFLQEPPGRRPSMGQIPIPSRIPARSTGMLRFLKPRRYIEVGLRLQFPGERRGFEAQCR